MVIQIVLTVLAAATASAMFSVGLRRRSRTMGYRPILAAMSEDETNTDYDIGPVQWEPVNRWESVPVTCGPDEDDGEFDLGGEG